jgi:hypothetical protein
MKIALEELMSSVKSKITARFSVESRFIVLLGLQVEISIDKLRSLSNQLAISLRVIYDRSKSENPMAILEKIFITGYDVLSNKDRVPEYLERLYSFLLPTVKTT